MRITRKSGALALLALLTLWLLGPAVHDLAEHCGLQLDCHGRHSRSWSEQESFHTCALFKSLVQLPAAAPFSTDHCDEARPAPLVTIVQAPCSPTLIHTDIRGPPPSA